jgi:phosphoglycerate dehydrogenase-like enzyme
LREGKIRGAALDVSDPEPLPDGHPLFTAPNVFITPHISWQTPQMFTRIQAVVTENLERLSKGERLINVMNREHHY